MLVLHLFNGIPGPYLKVAPVKEGQLALCERNPPVTSGFPSQRASNAEL